MLAKVSFQQDLGLLDANETKLSCFISCLVVSLCPSVASMKATWEVTLLTRIINVLFLRWFVQNNGLEFSHFGQHLSLVVDDEWQKLVFSSWKCLAQDVSLHTVSSLVQ